MKPVNFRASNIIYAERQPPYYPLPAHRSSSGQVTSCWRLTIRERLKTLLSGRVYVTLLTFGAKPQPQRLGTRWRP